MTARDPDRNGSAELPDALDDAIARVRDRLDPAPELAAPPPPAAPVLSVTFAGPGRDDFTVNVGTLSPAQVYAAAFYLDALARQIATGAILQAAQSSLVVGRMMPTIRTGGR